MLTSTATTHLTRFFLKKVSTQALQSTKTNSCRPPLSSLFRTMAQLQKAVVRSLPDQPNLTITLTIGGKQRNLDRPKNEPLEKPLSRIQKTSLGGGDRFNNKKSTANYNKKSSTSADASSTTTTTIPSPLSSSTKSHDIFLYDGPSSSFPPLDPATTTNEAAWCKSGRLLVIGEECWTVEVNPPTITSLSVLGMKCFVGIPICPIPLLQFANEEDCHWQWYCSTSATECTTTSTTTKAMKDGYLAIEGATQRLFTPTQDLVGKKLKVECIPVRREEDSSNDMTMMMVGEGMLTECGTVLSHPGPPAPLTTSNINNTLGRHQYTQHYTQFPDIRVMTYNILADQYASTEAAKNRIFSHCPNSFLQPDYRRPLVLGEILGYKADVMCLQEVDEKMFYQLLQPALKEYEYEGMYTNKAGAVREGSAMFWNSKRYRLVASHEFALKHLFSNSGTRVKPATPVSLKLEERSEGYQKVFEKMLSSSPALTHALQRVGTVAQMALLQPVISSNDNNSRSNTPPSSFLSSPPLMVANTHLFYHARAPHIRTMHTWGIIQEAHAFIQQYQKDNNNNNKKQQEPAMIFCGDLNSDLNDGIPGAIHLLSHGHLPADHWDWFFGMEFSMSARGATHSTATKNDNDTNDNGEEEEDELIEEGAMDQEVNKMLQHAPAVHPTSPIPSPSSSSVVNEVIVPGVDLSLPLSSLQAADELKSPVTNCVQGYQGLLDYSWYDGRYLQRKDYVPVPVLEEEEYLPSETYPSDHIAVVHTLTTRNGGSSSDGGQSGSGRDMHSNSGGDNNDDNNNKNTTLTTKIMPAAMYNVGIAAETLKAGKIIAVPTDTLYGLAAAASDSSAIRSIYALKQRKDTKPLAICVADVEDISAYGEIHHLPGGLLSQLLPGPVTIILRQQPDAPLASELNHHSTINNNRSNSIAVRIPNNQFIRGICRQHRGAVALTSANLSGGPSTLSINEFKPLWPACGIVFDGGRLQRVQVQCSIDGNDDVSHVGRNGSTIIDLSLPISSSDGGKKRYRIVRDGVALEETRRVMTEHGFVEEEE